MIRLVKITDKTDIYDKVEKLYITAFPPHERSPLSLLTHDTSCHSEVFAFYDGEVFCGFACLLTYKNITHIIYIAIDEAVRKHGYGSMALELIQKLKPENQIIVDIESETASAKNNVQRHLRRQFYTKNGYFSSGVRDTWRKEAYEILISHGSLSDAEFEDFWEQISRTNKNFEKF